MRIKAETSVGLFIVVAVIIFLYMTFQIGVLRFDRSNYYDYTVYFYDVSGLNKKSDVQIAGVKVGWVEDIELVNNGQQVRALVKVLKNYTLHQDAYGIIRQDGLLGTKYLEIIPGDQRLAVVKPGGILMKPSKEPVAIDAVLSEFQDIARNLHEITNAIRDVLGGDVGSRRLERAIEGFTQAAESFTEVARSMDGVIDKNRLSLEDLITDLRSFSRDLKEEFPNLARDVREGVDRVATQFEHAAGPIGDMVGKINKGEGVLGKLIGDEDIARDAKLAIQGVKDYFESIDRLAVIFDCWSEAMYGYGNFMDFRDSKGYFNVRLHPTEDYFYLLGLMGSFSGYIQRTQAHRQWAINECEPLIPTEMNLDDWARLQYAPIKYKETRILNSWLLNAQFGKIYDNLAFRVGIFEGSAGVGMDYEIPFECNDFRWVSTLEAWDFHGLLQRFCDHRVHVKWLNKLFFTESLYMTFGADDFISHSNRNAFFGFGFRFADDDVKYYATKIVLPS